jgi:light-regulated signal transduction histidine kinase (bacteriophytochrome)
LVSEAERARVEVAWERALLTGAPFDTEFQLVNDLCPTRVISWREVTGNHTFVMVDVSAQYRVQRERDHALQELEVSREELKQFAYVASHDLNEPLRMVASYSQLLIRRYKDVIGSEGIEYVDFIQGAVKRMKELLQDLVSYSRALHADLRLAPSPSGAALQWAIMNLQPEIQSAGAEIHHGDLPLVHADQNQLVLLFQHLIGNAVKFRSDRPPFVQVDAEPEDDMWRFAIRDNGIGIEPDLQDRIFAVFKRLHGKDVPGTGIGLAIAKKIVEAHGGRIWVESAPDKGSTFFFTLPTV